MQEKKDYRYVNMRNVEERAKLLNSTDDPVVPDCLRHALHESDDEKLDDATDKAATPAERVFFGTVSSTRNGSRKAFDIGPSTRQWFPERSRR